jgi:hypothetical protein
MKSIFIICLIILQILQAKFNEGYCRERCIEKIGYHSSKGAFNTIYALEADSNGYVYLATDVGMYFYNGKEILPFESKDRFNNSEIINLYKQKNGAIWSLPYYGKVQQINTQNHTLKPGIPFFEKANYKAYNVFEGEAATLHFHLSLNSSFIFRKCVNGVLVKDTSTTEAMHFNKYYLNIICKDSAQHRILPNEVFKLPLTKMRIIDDHYFAVLGKLFFVSHNKISLLFDANAFRIRNTIIIDIHVDADGIYLALMGETKGLFKYQNGKLNPIFTQSSVNGVTKDHFGNLYFIDFGRNLYKVSVDSVQRLPVQLNKGSVIKSLGALNSDSLFLTDIYGNLYVLDIRNGPSELLIRNPINRENNNVISYNDIDGSLLFICNSVLYQFYKTVKSKAIPIKYFRPDLIPVMQDILMVNGKCVINLKSAFQIFDLNSNKLKYVPFPHPIKSIQATSNNELSVATINGIYKIDLANGYQIEKVLTHTKLDDVTVYASFMMDDTIYYYTLLGLFRKNPGDPKYYLEFPISASSPFVDARKILTFHEYIIAANNTHFATYNTISKTFGTYEFKSFSEDEYLQNFVALDSQLVFSTQKALYFFPLKNFNVLRTIPKVVVSEIRINDSIFLHDANQIVVPYTSRNSFYLKFDVLNAIFDNSDKFSYELIIDGRRYSAESIRNQALTLSNLPAGVYTLKIKFEKIEVISVAFRLLPKWYQTFIFYFLIAFIFIALLVVLIYYIIRRRYRIKHEMAQTRNYMFQLEGSAKLNQLKPHFIFNALLPIQNFILKMENGKALEYLTNFSVLLRQMLSMSRVNTTSIAEEVNFLNGYMDLKQKEMSFSFQYTIVNEIEEIAASYLQIPTLLIQPIVENAITYGTASPSNHIRLFIKVKSKDVLWVIVQDGGEGFNLSEHLEFGGGQHALNIVVERLQLFRHETKLELGLSTHFDMGKFEVHLFIPILSKSTL